LIPREASKRVPIFDRGTGSKPERRRRRRRRRKVYSKLTQ